MASAFARVPNEIWTQILGHVAPPVPFVGSEDESFEEDAKRWRGDKLGQWKDIDALMLVSKKLNELASPFFWSYVVLFRDAAQASSFLTQLYKRTKPERQSILNWIKVLELANYSTAGLPTEWERRWGEHPAVSLIHYTPSLNHLELTGVMTAALEALVLPVSSPIVLLLALATRQEGLAGLTGLAVDHHNLFAAVLAVGAQAATLRTLSIFQNGGKKPRILNHPPPSLSLSLPLLRSMSIGLLQTPRSRWLELFVGVEWRSPAVAKAAYGLPPANALPPSSGPRMILADGKGALRQAYYRDFDCAVAEFDILAISSVRELSLRFETEDGTWPEPESLAEVLNGAPPGEVRSVEIVVVVESHLPAGLKGDQNLAAFVNRTRFPSLKRVVWVSYVKDNETENWSGHLLRWIVDLTKSGVVVDIQ